MKKIGLFVLLISCNIVFSQDKVIPSHNLINEGWGDLNQIKFWQTIFRLDNNIAVINNSTTREIIETVNFDSWMLQTQEQKDSYFDSLRIALNEDSSLVFYVTSGKSDYYQFHKVLKDIVKAKPIFDSLNVDSWYAQSILLIESPGKIRKSSVGAYGSFQLMESVAKQYGLKVNKSIDEREDFNKSAEVAAKLISHSCIPKAHSIVRSYIDSTSYSESDIWFQLLVLHIYHAGATNVKRVVDYMSPTVFGQSFITSLWQTNYKSFQNASQNYSQVAIAANIELMNLMFVFDIIDTLPFSTF